MIPIIRDASSVSIDWDGRAGMLMLRFRQHDGAAKAFLLSSEVAGKISGNVMGMLLNGPPGPPPANMDADARALMEFLQTRFGRH